MNKEILDELIKVAKQLDKVGLYKEASSVDKIAQNIQYNPQQSYEHLINEYKRHLKEDGKDYASKWMKSLFRWKTLPGSWGNWSPDKIEAFRAQAERLTLDDKAQEFSNVYLPMFIRQYSLDFITDKNDFNAKWEKMTQHANQAYGYYFGESLNAVLRKTKRVYDAKLAKFNL